MSKFIDESIRLLKAIDNYRARGAQDEIGSIESLHLDTTYDGSVVAEFYVSKPDDYTLIAYLDGNELHVNNERGESVFDYADEHGWTEDDINSMRTINEDYVEEEGDPSVIRVIADLAVEPGYNDIDIANSVIDNINDFVTEEFGHRVVLLDLTYDYNAVQNDYDTDDLNRALGLTESYNESYADGYSVDEVLDIIETRIGSSDISREQDYICVNDEYTYGVTTFSNGDIRSVILSLCDLPKGYHIFTEVFFDDYASVDEAVDYITDDARLDELAEKFEKAYARKNGKPLNY